MNNVNGTLAQATRGPVLLITLGTLIALDTFWNVGFTRTWPVLLIVFGIFKLVERLSAVQPAPPPDNPGGGGSGIWGDPPNQPPSSGGGTVIQGGGV